MYITTVPDQYRTFASFLTPPPPPPFSLVTPFNYLLENFCISYLIGCVWFPRSY